MNFRGSPIVLFYTIIMDAVGGNSKALDTKGNLPLSSL